jgi:hypothetical protein
MKKKYRDIVVEDIKYAYKVNPGCTCCNISMGLTLWKDNKIILNLTQSYEAWGTEVITPKTVEETIRKFILQE